jgi:hypothetical protein
MKKYLMMSLLALIAMTMTSCMHVRIGDKDWSITDLAKGHTNNTPTQVHQVGTETAMTPFEELSVAGPFNVFFEQGESNTVRVDGTAEQLEKITIYVKEGELFIDQRKNEPSGTFDGMRIFVTAPHIDGIDIAGSGTVTAPKALTVNDLNLDIAGSGDITIAQLTCKDLDIDIAGSGDVTIGMIQANKVDNEIAGSGSIDIAGLTCKNVYNDIAGSGDITLNNLNVDEVKTDIAGSGDVVLRGTARHYEEDIAGSGKVDVSGLKTANNSIQ